MNKASIKWNFESEVQGSINLLPELSKRLPPPGSNNPFVELNIFS